MRILKTLTVVAIALSFLLISAVPVISGGQYSGFIDNYPAFEPDKDQKGAKIYKKPGTDLKSYTKLMIDPVEIFYADDSKYKGIKPDELKTLADAFRAAFVEELEPDYPIVSKPGPGVLGLRLAITNVHAQKKKRSLLGYTPIGFAASTAKTLIAGQSISLVNATIEAEMLDVQTNERLGALIDSGPHAPDDKEKKLTSWEELENMVKFYAKRFRARMDAAHAK